MDIAEIKDVASVIGVVIAAVALAYTATNTRITARANRARFWLDLRTHFYRYDDVHRKLRPGGEWTNPNGPSTADEWVPLEAYMGLFEHCESMLQQGLIDEEQFRVIYKYRLENIVANDVIRTEKLINRAKGWPRFLALLRRMGINVRVA